MAIKIGDVQRQERRGTAASAISADPTLKEGEIGFETDTGNVKFGDGSTAWTSLSYINNVVQTFDISSANQTMTLPVVTGYPQSYDFFWTGGDGTYTATLAVTDSETVGGITAGTWTGEGEGSISCVSDGMNWAVKAYGDYVVGTSSHKITKMLNGEMRIIGSTTCDATTVASQYLGTTSGTTYQGTTSDVFDKTFVSIDHIVPNFNTNAQRGGNIYSMTTTGIDIRLWCRTSQTGLDCTWEAVGRWRT